jgi:hypothetical protein
MRRLVRPTALLAIASLLMLPVGARGQTSEPDDVPSPAQPPRPAQQQQQQQQPAPAPMQPYPYYQQRYAPPPGPPLYYAPRRVAYRETRRWGLFWGGVGVLGGVWLTNLLIGGIGAGEGAFYVPVIGPAIFAGQYAGRCCGSDQDRRAMVAFMVFDTLIGLGGLGMMIGGAATRQKVLVEAPSVTLVPQIVPGGGGISAVARF